MRTLDEEANEDGIMSMHMKGLHMAHTLGDGPIQAEYLAMMNAVAGGLDDVFNGPVRPKKTGFVLLVFPFDDDANVKGRCNFISNGADRKDIVALFKEMIARFEGQPNIKGSA